MDYRVESFAKKFNSASQHLGVKPSEIISLKLRDNVTSYDEYREFLDALEREVGLKWTKVTGELQGQGYLLTDDNSRVLIVEHETGLEILYIVGSIASLVGIVPLVLQWWRAFRGRYFRRQGFNDQGIEIRKLDEKGQLIEDHVHDSIKFAPLPLSLNTPLAMAAKTMERDLQQLTEQMRLLTARVEVLEKKIAGSKSVSKPKDRTGKKTSRR